MFLSITPQKTLNLWNKLLYTTKGTIKMNGKSLEKQKKGNLYVYKFGAGSKTPEYQPPTAEAVTKRIISSSIWSLRKSKSKKASKDVVMDTGMDTDKVVVVKENDDENFKVKEWERGEKEWQKGEKERVREMVKGNNNNGRKSVSSVEAILLSLASSGNNNVVEGRKSVSHSHSVDYTGKGKGFPSLQQKERKRIDSTNKIEEARKSVSHVENHVAYVGKFGTDKMEKPRKSMGAKLENNLASSIALFQVKVLVTDMPGFMQVHAFQCGRNTYDSMERFSARHLASNLKKEFDKVYGPAWHCIVGSSFGSFVTHATGCFLYFSMEKLCILLFRTKVQRAVQL